MGEIKIGETEVQACRDVWELYFRIYFCFSCIILKPQATVEHQWQKNWCCFTTECFYQPQLMSIKPGRVPNISKHKYEHALAARNAPSRGHVEWRVFLAFVL